MILTKFMFVLIPDPYDMAVSEPRSSSALAQAVAGKRVYRSLQKVVVKQQMPTLKLDLQANHRARRVERRTTGRQPSAKQRNILTIESKHGPARKERRSETENVRRTQQAKRKKQLRRRARED